MDDYCDWFSNSIHDAWTLAVAVVADDDDDNTNDFISGIVWRFTPTTNIPVPLMPFAVAIVAELILCDATFMITTNLKLFVYDRHSLFICVYAYVFHIYYSEEEAKKKIILHACSHRAHITYSSPFCSVGVHCAMVSLSPKQRLRISSWRIVCVCMWFNQRTKNEYVYTDAWIIANLHFFRYHWHCTFVYSVQSICSDKNTKSSSYLSSYMEWASRCRKVQ